jgi:RNA polymerase sigma-70 factor, ECF subfamily
MHLVSDNVLQGASWTYARKAGTVKPDGPQLRLVSSGPHGDGLGLDDKARFSSVVTPHLDAAYSLAQWLTRNRADAEDVVQEACLRAFRAISGFAGGNAKAWVLTIIRHTAYSWLGNNRQEALVAVDDLEAVELAQADPGDPNAETPETTVIALSDTEQLRTAIAALPAPYRDTLVLRDIEGLDYREIAKVTEAPIGTVMSRLARARHRLITAIKKQ